jgi:hypothetical protein
MGLTMKEKRTITKEVAGRYRRVSKKGKGAILDEFIELTGYNRAYASHVLHNQGVVKYVPRVAGRFSAMAGVAVAVIVTTAAYNFRVDVSSIRAMLATAYGLEVAVKIVILFILLNLGAYNRYVSIPLLREWAGGSAEINGAFDRFAGRFFAPFRRNIRGPMVALRFRRLVGLETVLILTVLFCAALLRHETPARHFMQMQHQIGSPMQHNMDMEHHMDQQ